LRVKKFEIGERLSLIPVEIVHAFKTLLVLLPLISS